MERGILRPGGIYHGQLGQLRMQMSEAKRDPRKT